MEMMHIPRGKRGNKEEISDRSMEIMVNTSEKCCVMTIASFILAFELGLLNHSYNRTNGYLLLIASAPSSPMLLARRSKEVRLASGSEATRN